MPKEGGLYPKSHQGRADHNGENYAHKPIPLIDLDITYVHDSNGIVSEHDSRQSHKDSIATRIEVDAKLAKRESK